MEVIRSWWEVPCIAHFCHIFKKPFKLPSFEIEELEDALLLDCFPSPSKLIVDLFCNFLNGIIDSDITGENWSLLLKLHLKWRCEHLHERWNPLSGDHEYKDLDTYSRVCIMHKLCHWRLELDDIADLLRGIDGPSLRLEPMGRDMDGNTYWYFFGTRLYKEEGKKKKKKKKDDSKESTPVSMPVAKKGKEGDGSTSRGKGMKAKGNTPGSQRGRSKQVVHENATPTRGRGTRNLKKSCQVMENGRNEEEESIGEGPEEEDIKQSQEEEARRVDDIDGSTSLVTNCTDCSSEKSDSKLAEVRGGGPGPGNVPISGWSVACNTVEEWNDVIESLRGSKNSETKRLVRNLQDFLPEVEYIHSVREKQIKKRLLAELPRRTSDRIAIKTAIKEEEERFEAMEREMQREEIRQLEAEEERAKEEEAEKKRQKRMEEALERRKAREEQQVKQRMEEESNWEKAMSGELSGRRKAAIGAAENVSEVQRLAEESFITDDKEFDLYTAMHKILSGLRKHEEFWVFEDPVTEVIAPGYFEVVDKPMDYVTVEKKLEEQAYKSKDEFIADVELIYDNCCNYNGEESEYFELAEEMRKMFHSLVKIHFEGKANEEKAEGKGKKVHRRESRSPSTCKTPELTSESSSEEDSDDGSDDSYVEGRSTKKSKSKGSILKLTPSLEHRLGVPGVPPPLPHLPHPNFPLHAPPPPPPSHMPPHLYQHYMQQYMAHARMPHPPLHIPPGPDMYPHGSYPLPRHHPPPYPGFQDHNSARPPAPGLYPLHPPSEHRPMYPIAPPPHSDMLSRPMYPPPNHFPTRPSPHPSHPSHPAHPHHATYRQQVLYDMQFRGMDPQAVGMGFRPGIYPRPGMPQFRGIRPSHSDVSPTIQPKAKDGKLDAGTESSADVEVSLKNSAEPTTSSLSNSKDSNNNTQAVDSYSGDKDQTSESKEPQPEGSKDEEISRMEENDDSRSEEKESRDEESDIPRKEDDAVGHEKNALRKEERGEEKRDEASDHHEDEVMTNDSTRVVAPPKKENKQLTPEQVERYRYQQHMMALHQQRKEAIARGYPPPPPHPHHTDEAAAASYYAHYNFPANLHPDPRQLEAAQHHYWMEMEARRRHYMKQAQYEQHRRHQEKKQQQQQTSEGTKERAAETGQEGLEEVPDYQDSLRKYALGLGEHREGNGSSWKDADIPSNNKNEKMKAPGHHHGSTRYSQHRVMPNGYPYPYPIPPTYHPGHHHMLTEEDIRNGMGYPPPHGYYPPSYRMPYYPTMHRQDMWPRPSPTMHPATDGAENGAPPAKKPRLPTSQS